MSKSELSPKAQALLKDAIDAIGSARAMDLIHIIQYAREKCVEHITDVQEKMVRYERFGTGVPKQFLGDTDTPEQRLDQLAGWLASYQKNLALIEKIERALTQGEIESSAKAMVAAVVANRERERTAPTKKSGT